MSIKDFSSIHNHSHFSFLDGLSRPEDMVVKAKEKGLRSIALTDHGVMHGISDFYLHGKKHGVRTIYGFESYCIDDLDKWRKEHEAYGDEKERKKKTKVEDAVDDDATNLSSEQKRRSLYRKGHLVLIAQNNVGLANLYNMTHLAHKEGMYMKPRVDKKMLASHNDGVIASSACMGGVVANKCWAFKRGDAEWSEVIKEAEEFREIFGDRFFLELQFNESDSQRFINDCIIKVSDETGIKLDVTVDSHYTNADEWEAQEILYMLRSNKTISTRGDDWDFNIRQLYIKSPQEMWETFEKYGGEADIKKVREAFENTLLIDSMIEDFEPDTHQRLPTLKVPNPFKALGEASIQRLKQLGLDKDEKYAKRLIHEMKLIKDKGFSSYFLIMKDIITKAKERMAVGPGRGSSAGSLVCFLNGITDLDPIKHNLMFERFINPDRCFVEGTIVKTKESGFIRIEDVIAGDNVFTHKNTWNRVLDIYSFEKNEELVCIEYDGSIFICTSNHKLLINFEDREKFYFADEVLQEWIKNQCSFIKLVDEKHNKVDIQDVSLRAYNGKVYDLEVECAHSYQVFGIKSAFINRYGYGLSKVYT